MNKLHYIVLGVTVLLIGGFFTLNSSNYKEQQRDEAPVLTYKDATYAIAGRTVTLKGGLAEEVVVPGSSTKIVTRYFGNEVRHDFDKDGREDVAFLLTQEPGGSGTYYYVVSALNKEGGWVGSQGLLLGDRIAPQTTEMGTGDIVVVNYADRKVGESFAVAPSMGKSAWLFLDVFAMQFGEVEQDFSGEADPAKMTLDMKSWVWINMAAKDGSEVLPKQSLAFTLDFSPAEKQFSATTDCNRVAGTYATKDKGITFGQMISTKMYCEDSQEGVFTEMLGGASSYEFTGKGQLVLTLKAGGSATFR